jgi:lysophospholipase L1-like esterase
MDGHRRRSPSVRRLLLTAGAAAAPALGMEIAGRAWLEHRGEGLRRPLWIQDPALGARMRPGYKGPDDRGVEVELNSLGLRSPEIELPKPAGRFRVVAMGDSVTYGHLVGEEETYPRVLQRELVDRGVEGAEVVNAGVLGYSTYQGAVLLERQIVSLEPDVVLFAYMNNDRWDSDGKVHTAEAIRASYDQTAIATWFLNHTALGNILLPQRGKLIQTLLGGTRRVSGRAFTSLPPRDSKAPLIPGDYRLEQLDRFRGAVPVVDLEQRRELCHRVLDMAEAHGFRLVFLQLYEHPYGLEPLRRATESFAAREYSAALEGIDEYFSSPPRQGTSAAHYDLFANDLLARVYEAQRLPEPERSFYHPRAHESLALHLDVELHGISAAVARERRGEVLDLRDFGAEHYRDNVHLSPLGHAVTARRIAALLSPSR